MKERTPPSSFSGRHASAHLFANPCHFEVVPRTKETTGRHRRGGALQAQLTLSSRRGSLVHLVTNEFGEFRGEIENSGDLELVLPNGGGNPNRSARRPQLDTKNARRDPRRSHGTGT